MGTLALSAATALRLGVQLAILPVLARFVGPQEYGLVALALPFVMFANVLSEGGMTNALGRQTDVSWRLESTVFWLAGGVGAVVAVFCGLLAWPMGDVMREPRLPWLIAALTPILVLNALATVSNARIIREGRFYVFAGGDLIATAVSATVAIAAASQGAGAWSLVAQQLSLWICKFIWVTVASKVTIRLYCRPREAIDLVRFGLHSIGSTFSDFTARNLDNMIVGLVLSAAALGHYAMAYQIVRIPDLLISGPLYLYIFSAVARTTAFDPSGVRDLAVRAVRLAATALAPLFCGLALSADLAVPLVLGGQWDGVISPLALLSGAGFAFSMCSVVSAILMGHGLSSLQFRISLILGVATVGAVALSARYGVAVVSAVLAVTTLTVAMVYLSQIVFVLRARALDLLLAFKPAVAGLVVMVLALTLVRREIGELHETLQFIVVVAAGGLGYALTVGLVSGRVLLQDLRAFLAAHSDAPALAVEAVAV